MWAPAQDKWDPGATRLRSVTKLTDLTRRQLVSTGEQHLGLQQEDPLADDRPLDSTAELTEVPVPPEELPSASSDPIVLRRSARKGKAPEWHKDYHIP